MALASSSAPTLGLARSHTVAFSGIDVKDVDVQVQISSGLPAFMIVGLPDKAVGESRERVRSALGALGLGLPPKRITVNLAPADLAKVGSHFDLPIALAVLVGMGALPGDAIQGFLALGELALDGSVQPVNGVLPAAVAAAARGQGLICTEACGSEAAWLGDDVDILATPNLLALINHFNGNQLLSEPKAHIRDEEPTYPRSHRHQGPGNRQACARNRCRRRSQSADGRPAGLWQIHAGFALARAFAPARSGRDPGSQYGAERRRCPGGRKTHRTPPLSQPASCDIRSRDGRRRHTGAAGRGLACPQRRTVFGRAAGVQPRRTRIAPPAAGKRPCHGRPSQSSRHLSSPFSADRRDEPLPVVLPLDSLIPVRIVTSSMKKAKKYQQIAVSIEEVGIVEPLIVHRAAGRKAEFLLLDGHMRLEVLKDLGAQEAPCLIAKDDEAFTYNKRINRLTGIQEHYMILRAIENGVSESKIAKALGVNVGRIRDKRKLLDGICPEAVDLLKDRRFPVGAAASMRRMKPVRQIEMAELMVATNNFSSSYARALLAATPASQLVEPSMKKPLGGLSEAERQTMEREIETIHRDVKAVEEDYGINMLRLVVANGYLGRLLENEQVAGYLRRHHGELFRELQTLQEGISADMGISSKAE